MAIRNEDTGSSRTSRQAETKDSSKTTKNSSAMEQALKVQAQKQREKDPEPKSSHSSTVQREDAHDVRRFSPAPREDAHDVNHTSSKSETLNVSAAVKQKN